MMSRGVSAGATRPNQPDVSKPGSANSAIVGRSGAALARFIPVEASAVILASSTCCSTVEAGEKNNWMRPATRSVTACGLPA